MSQNLAKLELKYVNNHHSGIQLAKEIGTTRSLIEFERSDRILTGNYNIELFASEDDNYLSSNR